MSGKLLFQLPGHNPTQSEWQPRGGNYIALAMDDSVKIWDRSGRVLWDQRAKKAHIKWDHEGQYLAVIQQKMHSLLVFPLGTKRSQTIEFELKDNLTIQAWSKVQNILAVGTAKGSLILVDFKTDQKLPILGKHGKKITQLVWSKSNLIGVGSIDGAITINNDHGDTIHAQKLRSEPIALKFGAMKSDTKVHEEDTISCLLEQEVIFLWRFTTDEQSELSFQTKYGKIVNYEWYGDGYLAIGFDSGRVIGVSTHMAEIGTEIFNIEDHSDFLSSMKITADMSKLVTAGESSVRIHTTANMKVVDQIIPIEDDTAGGFRDVALSDSGNLVAACSNNGTLYVYLTELNVLGASCSNRLAFLSSLNEVTLFETGSTKNDTKKIQLKMEPTFLGLGPYHFCSGINNRSVFHTLDEDTEPISHEYSATVKKVSVGIDYVAVHLADGRLHLHIIEQSDIQPERESRLFPPANAKDQSAIISSHIKGEMLIYSTQNGKIHYFLLDEWNEVNCYEHKANLKSIYPDQVATRLLLIDENSHGAIYSPVDDSLLPIDQFSATIQGCLWDAEDSHVFCVWDSKNTIYTYSIHDLHIDGPKIELVNQGRKPKGQNPLMLHNGFLYLQTNSGKLNRITLTSHKFKSTTVKLSEEDLNSALALRQWEAAFLICSQLDNDESWIRAGEGAIKCLEISAASKFYRQIQNAGMVLSLQELNQQEDTFYLQGMCCLLIGQFNRAQDFFLKSTNPLAALEMRRDLQNWEEALQLAGRLAPGQIAEISREFAAQQEFEGNYSGALTNYERSIQEGKHLLTRDELSSASGGVARCSIRMGDLRRGIQLAMNNPAKSLKRECAEILEKMKQFKEAGDLFIKGEFWEKGAASYLKAKLYNKVGEIIHRVDTGPGKNIFRSQHLTREIAINCKTLNKVKIHQAYAKARENEGNIDQALEAYNRAGDHESRIRLLLAKNRPAEAEEVVREHESTDGANLVARYFIRKGDYGSGIEFLVISKCNTEAFQLAQQHGQMETYSKIIMNNGNKEDYYSIAVHFENENNYIEAGKFYLRSENYERALKLFLRTPVNATGENILLAIDTVGQARNDKLSRLLLDYLLGHGPDGESKEAKYLFRFYVALEQYTEAASTAVIISRDQQMKGDYRKAREILFGMSRDLKMRGIKNPAEMSSSLLLLHSYLLVRPTLSVRNDHHLAARLLCRVAKSISKFPAHIVQLLTKTVIECNKTGLKKSAFDYAALLMRPEYRDDVDSKYRRPIEKLVRERRGAEEVDEPAPQSPCPYCEKDYDSYELTCPHCQATSPFCIATGQHITRSSMTKCPNCDYLALLEPLLELISADGLCPLCSQSIDQAELTVLQNPTSFLY